MSNWEVSMMKRFAALLMTLMLLLSSAFAESATAALQEMYAQAELLMVQGDYSGAAAKFEALGAYSDASQMSMYCKAIAAAETLGLYVMAVDAFVDLGAFKDSAQMAKYYEGRWYEANGTLDIATASDSALDEALLTLGDAEKIYAGLAFFKDSMTRYASCGAMIKEIKNEQSRRAADKMEATYQKALKLEQNGDYTEAIKLYKSLNGYKDSEKRISICETALLDGKYAAAQALMNAEKYREAITAFTEIATHKDSAEQIKACETNIIEAQVEKLAEAATVGSYITFGIYEQDNKTANGKEAIEWLVLAKENNRMLVISRYALAVKPYNKTGTKVTWENSTLRTWLNKDFLNNAFGSAGQAVIPTVTVSADKNPKHSTDPGKSTQDKVFLLSCVEANKYFKTNSDRECKPTVYAKAQSQDGYVVSGDVCWWLRSPGGLQNMAACVDYSGAVHAYGDYVYIDDGSAVRPAMWIELTPDADHNAAATTTPASKSVVITSDSAKIRTEASISAGLVKTAYKGESFTLLGESGDFYQISVNGKTGYVHKGDAYFENYIETGTAAYEGTAKSDSKLEQGSSADKYVIITNSSANIRSGPDGSATKIKTAMKGETFPLIGEEGNWYMIDVNGQTGYVTKSLSAIK